MIDLFALALLVGVGHIGWRRGTVLTALSAGGLVVGYIGAILLYRPVGRIIEAVSGVPPLLALPLGGMVTLVTISILMRVAAVRFAVQRRRRLDQGWTPSQADRTGGAVLGVAWATGVVIVLAWAVVVVRGLTGQGPDAENTISGRAASAVVGKAVYAVARRATGDEVFAATLALVAVRPQAGTEWLNRLLGDERLHALFDDPALRAALIRSDAAAIARHPSIRSLAEDEQFLEAAYAVRLVDEDPRRATSTQQLTEQLLEHLGPMVRTAEVLKDDPEVQAILQDPAFMEKVEQRDLGALAVDPKFNRLAEKILGTFRTVQGG